MPVRCPFCNEEFATSDSWCPHYIGVQSDLTLDDYHDFISGEYPAETIEDEEGNAVYFMKRLQED